jgi:hypothetical protein
LLVRPEVVISLHDVADDGNLLALANALLVRSSWRASACVARARTHK